jgi:tetratricopeptide (TPR) repeat protein
VRFLLPVAFLLCASVAVRLVWAEQIFRDGSPAQVHIALRLLSSTPNAEYFERLADLNADEAAQSLRQALQANPRLTSARIGLGLLLEKRGDFGAAESILLEAAHYDRQYFPAWTLANYYFRHEKWNDFWQWSRIALPLDTGDRKPFLRLVSMAEPNESAVLDRLQGGVQIAYPYMDLLIDSGRLDAAQRVARVVLQSQQIQRTRLVDLSTRQLKAGNVAWALEIWNALNPPLDPERGPVLPSIFETPDGEGFHIRQVSNPGIWVDWKPESAAFLFDGAEPDGCLLFELPIPAPQRKLHYRLHYEYKSSMAGARWSMAGRESPGLPIQPDWGPVDWTITVDTDTRKDSLRLLALQLSYRRKPGTTPARGELDLRNLQLQIL